MKRGAIIFLLAWSLCTAAAAGDEGYRFKRHIEVPREGWMRLFLDGRVIAEAQPGWRWNILDPEGEAVRFNVLAPQLGFLKAQTLSLAEEADGWRIVFDLGPRPVRHSRMEINLAQQTSASGCRLEGSHDLERWSFLGEGALFRLGSGETLHRSALDYDGSDARYLRLWWPKSAGFPEFRAVGVQSLANPPGDPIEVSLEVQREEPSGDEAAYRLHLPGKGLKIRSLVVEGLGDFKGKVGYRLYRGLSQRWEVVAAGEFESAKPAIIDLGERLLDCSQFRLEFYHDDVAIAGARVEVPAMWLLFHAEKSGRYALAYGGDPGERQTAIASDNGVGPVIDIRPQDDEELLPRAPIPKDLTAPVTPSEAIVAGSRWRVSLGEVAVGKVVRLVLPQEVRHEIGHSTGKLRLLAGEKEVPHILWTAAEPEAVFELRGLTSTRIKGERYRRIQVRKAELLMPLSQIEIFSHEGHLETQLRVLFPVESRPGVEAPPVEVHASWQCGPTGEIPCRAVVDRVPANSTGEMQIMIEPAGDTASGSFTIRGWTARPTLFFVRPPAEDVVLAWDRNRKSRERKYALHDFSDSLMAMPWSEASLDLDSTRQEKDRQQKIARFAMIATLIFAALALLWILARNLRRGAAPS